MLHFVYVKFVSSLKFNSKVGKITFRDTMTSLSDGILEFRSWSVGVISITLLGIPNNPLLTLIRKPMITISMAISPQGNPKVKYRVGPVASLFSCYYDG